MTTNDQALEQQPEEEKDPSICPHGSRYFNCKEKECIDEMSRLEDAACCPHGFLAGCPTCAQQPEVEQDKNPCGNDECNKINSGIDKCIQPIVKALNDCGMKTVASCCGHGKTNGRITLKDGREIFIIPDFDTATAIERYFPDIHGNPPFSELVSKFTPELVERIKVALTCYESNLQVAVVSSESFRDDLNEAKAILDQLNHMGGVSDE